MLLDIVEVAQSHTGVNLAAAFAKILDDYAISDKVFISANIYIYITDWAYQILGITCNNTSNNDSMIESLATIMSQFSGEANRAQCLAHIVNLVAKIILRQFDKSIRKEKKDMNNEPNNLPELPGEKDGNETDDDEDEELARVLDKEEKEMDEADDKDSDLEDTEALARDVRIMEEVMEEEIERVVKKVKPVGQVLFKVCLLRFHSTLLYSGLFWERCLILLKCNQ